MVKITLIIILFAACSYSGFIYGDGFRKRYIDLKEAYKQLILLQNEIVFNNTPIPEALALLGKKGSKPINRLLSSVSNKLIENTSDGVQGAFKESYSEIAEDFYFTSEDKGILSDFTKSLGQSGVYGQEKIFKLALENLKINIDDAYEISKRNTKLYKYLGICCGAMISIFLL